MSDVSALLPRNATALEKALAQSTDLTQELSPGIVELRGFKHNPLEQIVPYLVHEYGLAEIAEYLPNLRDVISDGIAWQRLIGTPAALHKALGWINHDGDIEEFDPKATKWWWFQVHLPFEPRNTQFVRPMTHLVKASKPLRSEFARVTAGHDVRAFRLNTHRLNGGAFLNDWSGVRRVESEPVLSLRVHRQERVNGPMNGKVQIDAVQVVHYHRPTVVNIPRHNPVYRLAAAVAVQTNYQNRATVTYQNAPYVHSRFGVPVPRVQTGTQ